MLVPVATPLAMPDVLPIVAIVVLLLLHVPPLTVFVRFVVSPAQTVRPPVIGAVGFTVIVLVAVVAEPHRSVAVTV